MTFGIGAVVVLVVVVVVVLVVVVVVVWSPRHAVLSLPLLVPA